MMTQRKHGTASSRRHRISRGPFGMGVRCARALLVIFCLCRADDYHEVPVSVDDHVHVFGISGWFTVPSAQVRVTGAPLPSRTRVLLPVVVVVVVVGVMVR